MSIKHEMNTTIRRDPNNVPAIADEAGNGTKSVPTTLYQKSADGESFVPIDENTPLPTRVISAKMEYFGASTDTRPSNAGVPVGSTFFEIDTQTVYMNDGSNWVVI